VPRFIELTSDFPSYNTSGYMPLLDLQCRVEENRVLHKYFKKPINTKYCLLEGSTRKVHNLCTEMCKEAAQLL
jgi:hypothetical protein